MQCPAYAKYFGNESGWPGSDARQGLGWKDCSRKWPEQSNSQQTVPKRGRLRTCREAGNSRKLAESMFNKGRKNQIERYIVTIVT